MVRGLQSRSVLITFFGKKLRKPQLELLSWLPLELKRVLEKLLIRRYLVKGQLFSDHKFVVAPCHRGDGTIWDLDHFLTILALLFPYFLEFDHSQIQIPIIINLLKKHFSNGKNMP